MTWVPLVLFFVLCARVTVLAAGPIRDPDAWWHLRVGHQFWSGSWTLWDTGPLSTFGTEEWTPRDWIPQLVASKFEDWFGLPGVVWLYGAALLLFLVVAYVTCRREADALPATLAVAMAFLAASGSLSQRPQMVSFILMFVVVGAWLAVSRDLKPRWWLVPLTWLWACSHGMWYCGVVIGIVVVVGLILDGRLTARQALKLATIPLLSVVAAALTPVGPRLLLTVFDTTGMWQFVTEWGAPSFREIRPAIAVLMIFVLVLTWTRRASRTSWVDLGLLSIAVGWILLAARTVPLGSIVLAPLVAVALQSWIRPGVTRRISRPEGASLTGVFVACLVGLALAAPSAGATPGGVPNALNDELDGLAEGSPILNEYALGGWLHWRHPDLQTVVDGFTDGYTPREVAAYMDARSVAAGWETYVADTGAESALLEVDSPLATALVDRLNWEPVADDEGFVLLIASGR